MDAILLARVQFALTVGFHYIFPPITIGLAWIIVVMKALHLRTGDDVYGAMGRFWVRVFALSFAVGVATGIVMEFQFGMNWAEYSRFVGDIFGAPLAAEGLFAFFLESTFVGLLVFGEKKLSKRMHLVSAIMVAAGATLSAFWIIVANSWQQTPAGYVFNEVTGRAELTDFWAAVFNPSTIPRYSHVISGALVSGAFFVMGLSAWLILRGRHLEFAKRSLRIALVFGFVGSLGQLATGHFHGVQVAETQESKLAALDGIFETETNAPMVLFGIPNEEEGRMDAEVAIPGLLSILVGGSPDTEVKGLNDIPRDEWPPVAITFFSFRIMEYLGFWFIALTTLAVILLWRKKLWGARPVLWAMVASLALPVVANEFGWIAAEVGRQPWIVWGEMRTSDAISVSVPAHQILISIIAFSIIYILLLFVWIFLLTRKMKHGPDEPGDPDHDADPAGEGAS